MSDGSCIFEDLEIVSSFERFVAEEMNLFEAVRLEETETIGFVPSAGEDIEGDFAPDGVCEVELCEFLLERLQ